MIRLTVERLALSISLALLCGASIPPGYAQAGGEITVYSARKIVTMDDGNPIATAVAVRDGTILSVGDLESIKPWLAQSKYVLDDTFRDKVLLPGFVEPHGHPIIGGTALTRPLLTHTPSPNPYGPDFPGVKNRAEALTKLREYVARSNKNETLICWGYDLTAMGGQHLDKHILDDISPIQPLIVWEASEHFVYANSAAMKKYGITAGDTKITGIQIGIDGQPNGQFLGTLAAERMMQQPLAELMQPSTLHKSIKYLMDLSRKNGITTTSEMALGLIDFNAELPALENHFNTPESPLRLVVVTDAESARKAKGDKALDWVSSLRNRNTDKLIFNGAKFFADDAFLSLGMAIENPGYIDGRKGIFITPPSEMVPRWLPWWERKFHIHVHTNGNAGNEATVNALDGLMQAYPRFDHRFTFEHYGISTPEQARRIKALGGVVSVNPYYLYARSELNAPYIGSDRAYTAVRLKTLTDLGIVTSLHTDTPVAPPFPLEEVWIAVNRHGLSGHVRGPAERISLEQALRMVTIDAAYTLGVDDKVGSIRAGKMADFVVLDHDPFSVAPEHIRQIKVWGTVSGGKVFPAASIHQE